MNLPNAITLSRLVVTAATFVCLELIEDGAKPDLRLMWWAFALFLVAACTDFLDGYFARKWNMVTAFGRVADPFADKVLIAGSFVLLLKFPAATAVTESGSTASPVTPGRMVSGQPPCVLVSTGRPHAAASMFTTPKPSP